MGRSRGGGSPGGGVLGHAGADKAGAETVVLKLATIDRVNNNGQSYGPEAFLENLEKVSEAGIKVEVTRSTGRAAPEAESDLVEAIASGEVDGGWPSTRAFANAGITGLEAVEAPMTVTSYAAEKALVSGPVADKLLAKLDGTGVVGLNLAVGPLRRPFAAEAPLLGPEDWAGATFRVYNSPVQIDAVRLLGATPVNLSLGWIDEVRAGRLRGVEFDIAQYAADGQHHRGRLRHRQRRTVAEGLCPIHQPEAIRRAQRRTAGLGAGGGRGGHASLGRCDL